MRSASDDLDVVTRIGGIRLVVVVGLVVEVTVAAP
jgi:hypothetical protein